MQKRERRLRRRRSVEEEEEDQSNTFPIDELPEGILNHVLSFLPLKEAAATSAVCTKWRYSWTHPPRTLLDFNFTSHAKSDFSIVRTTDKSILFYPKFEAIEKRTPHYIEFVDRLMSSHPSGNNLDEFSISLPLNPVVHGGAIDRWLMFALSRSVERLKFDFTNIYRYIPECCYYTFPATAEFRSLSLKSLCLKSVRIEGEALERLLVSSACPSLESIVLQDNFRCSNLKLCLASLSRLKHLELWDCHSLDSIEVLDSPSLVSFKLKPVAVEHCFLNKLPKLAQVSVAMGRAVGKLVYMKPFTRVFSQLKRLEIDGNMVATYPEVEVPFFRELTKLEELEITVRECEKMDLLPYAVLAGKAPRLKKLVMRVLYPGWYRNNDIVLKSPRIRPSFVHLKVLEFYGYYGRDGDNAFIWYLVENAASLQTVVIDPSYQPADERGRCAVKTWDDRDVVMSSREWEGYEQGQLRAAVEFGRRLPAQVKLVIA